MDGLAGIQSPPCLEVVGQVVEVKMATVAVTQHLVGSVLTRDDDKTAALDVKGIVGVGIGNCARRFGMNQLEVGQ